MKLISCYIEGFGKFYSQSFTFSPTLTVFKEENGWGKTTLADFIKCMLYGMDNGRGKAISANDRLKYEPWRGGGYGGYLLFSAGGKTYRVERSFGRTAAMDTVRIYDANNMLCYDFGEKGERLGETLFGVNADSFQKSVYIPQGEIETQGLPDDMKNRLLSLLSTGGKGENGAERAIERLDEADRALRSRRVPKKGKLDEIDEQLALLSARRLQKEENVRKAALLRQQAKEAEQGIEECTRRIDRLNAELEEMARKKEREVRFQAAQSVQGELGRIEGELSELLTFFKGVNPITVNVEGLQKAVSDFYALQERLLKTEEKLHSLSPSLQGRETLCLQLTGYEKQLLSYEGVLSQTERAATKRVRRKKYIPPKRKSNFWIGALSLVLAVVGSVTATENIGIGLALFALAVLGVSFVFFRVLPRYEKVEKQAEKATPNEALLHEYAALKSEVERLRGELKAYPEDLAMKKSALLEEKEQAIANLQAIETGIRNFLQNFAFTEVYDYRACVARLKEKIATYKRLSEEKEMRKKELSAFSQEELSLPSVAMADPALLKREKAEWEERKESLLAGRTAANTSATELEKRISGDLTAEESALRLEKERLERRRKAILAAMEILQRAKANMASRYLVPVETGCKQYLAELGFSEGELHFTSQGTPMLEQQGRMRETDYYSQGLKELLGLCMRIALVDAVYEKEMPVLILDDPLVNLDDKKTAKAKEFIKNLSKKYQILYLTCKSERKL